MDFDNDLGSSSTSGYWVPVVDCDRMLSTDDKNLFCPGLGRGGDRLKKACHEAGEDIQEIKTHITNINHDIVAKEKSAKPNRKPVITTITAKNDNSKVYKAVTFTDNREVTPIQINIPSQTPLKQKEKELKPSILKPPEIETTVKEKVKSNTKIRRNRKEVSPDRKSSCCMTTEVAKWAPQCITTDTKPYYEAWVDTTLTAITKTSLKDNVLQRYLDRPRTPELVYNNMDERYTGRIKVRQRLIKKS
ncbi:unnamed protein product [Leptidea sinapis]|uniref:Uncharacterized protein n=1 Tax=Leptidea sinapis TaxID=189913 RepID=A0A5E4QNV5_9NEOP|nr:unnamed protein product [Leptidea sinapis]